VNNGVDHADKDEVVELPVSANQLSEDQSASGRGRRATANMMRDFLSTPDLWSVWTAPIALAIVAIVFAITAPSFTSPSNLEQVLSESAILALMAIGQSFVIIAAGIDLSQAAVLTLASVFLGEIVLHANTVGIGIACLAAIAGGSIVGWLNGLVIAKIKITDFIVTLGALSVASGIALVLTKGAPTQITSTFLLKLSTGSVGYIGYPVFIALAAFLVGQYLLFHTRFGTYVFATGGDREAARAMGIRVERVRIIVYVVSGFLAGVAAILYTARIGAAEPAPDTTLLLDSIASVVLGGVSLFGGRGNIASPIIGAVLLTALSNGLTLLSVSEFYEPIVVGLIVIAAATLMRYQKD
jgi:ribose transport system permease protein